MAKIHLIHKDPLTAAIKALVRGFGSDPREVDLVTDNLIQANLTGHDSHGIGMLPKYSEAFVEGGLRPNAHVKTTLDGGAMLRLDGQAGFGQVIGREAMEMGIARAKQFGSCIVALGNSHHLCRIGAWAEMAVAENLISVHFTNVISRPIVAPFGGGDARFGTNPFTVGIPVPGGDPILLDFATSVMAQGKARVAYNKGEQMPPGRLIDNKGMPTTDPKFAVVEPTGAIVTFGEHKGYGMAVVCELLGGALAAGMACHEPATGKKRVLNGMLTIIFDPARLSDGALFAAEMQGFIDWVKASPVQPGFDRVRLAGEPEREWRAKRMAEGIPVDETTWGDLLKAAERLKVNPAEVNRLAGLG
ncbi:MAG: malate/lactate/ureidoglycolate dehydrogenase [Proteobacteria bacterium]|nr:malate/lactate/ureidoglycolate dehydrogenase [Pseudomonadota bacterium]